MSTEQDRRKETREEVATILAASKACKVAACAGDKFATKSFKKKDKFATRGQVENYHVREGYKDD